MARAKRSARDKALLTGQTNYLASIPCHVCGCYRRRAVNGWRAYCQVEMLDEKDRLDCRKYIETLFQNKPRLETQLQKAMYYTYLNAEMPRKASCTPPDFLKP